MFKLEHITDSKFIFIAAILLGLFLPELSSSLEPLLVPVLVVMMTFSIKDVCFHHLKKSQVKNIVNLLIINFVFLTAGYIIGAKLFISNPLYQKGFLILGIMPPAVGIISLAYILKGDTELSFITEFIGYAFAILFIPFMSMWLFADSVSPWQIIKVLVYVILIPFIVSRLIHHKLENKKLFFPEHMTKIIINVCYAISFYIIIGINRPVFLNNFKSLVPIILLLFVLKFITGTTIYLFFKNMIKKKIEVLYVLFGTFKNGGAATAITILLFGSAATVPLAVNAIIVPLYIIFLEWFILVEVK